MSRCRLSISYPWSSRHKFYRFAFESNLSSSQLPSAAQYLTSQPRPQAPQYPTGSASWLHLAMQIILPLPSISSSDLVLPWSHSSWPRSLQLTFRTYWVWVRGAYFVFYGAHREALTHNCSSWSAAKCLARLAKFLKQRVKNRAS